MNIATKPMEITPQSCLVRSWQQMLWLRPISCISLFSVPPHTFPYTLHGNQFQYLGEKTFSLSLNEKSNWLEEVSSHGRQARKIYPSKGSPSSWQCCNAQNDPLITVEKCFSANVQCWAGAGWACAPWIGLPQRVCSEPTLSLYFLWCGHACSEDEVWCWWMQGATSWRE